MKSILKIKPRQAIGDIDTSKEASVSPQTKMTPVSLEKLWDEERPIDELLEMRRNKAVNDARLDEMETERAEFKQEYKPTIITADDMFNYYMKQIEEIKARKGKVPVGRFVTLTNRPEYKNWTYDNWHYAVKHYLTCKTFATDRWHYALEKHMDGSIHAHIIFLYDACSHEGLKSIYQKKWTTGHVNVKHMNFRTNKNALGDALNYLNKDECTQHRESENWSMIEV